MIALSMFIKINITLILFLDVGLNDRKAIKCHSFANAGYENTDYSNAVVERNSGLQIMTFFAFF